MKKTTLFLMIAAVSMLEANEIIHYPEFEDSVSFYASLDRKSVV